MNVRFKYNSIKAAKDAASKLPISCKGKFHILTDRTNDAYLEVPSDYEDYVERYLNPKNYE